MARAVLSLGSNIGEKSDQLRLAVQALEASPDIRILKRSSFYTTAPVGYLDQDDFVNAVILVETSLSPYELLSECQRVEQALKRERVIRWGPRTIDIDILCFEDIQNDDPILTIPHPRMTERAFVLVPLSEIDGQRVVLGKTIEEWVTSQEDQQIRKMTHEKW